MLNTCLNESFLHHVSVKGVHGSAGILNQKCFKPCLSRTDGSGSYAIIIGETTTINLGNTKILKLLFESSFFTVSSEARVGFNHFNLTFKNLDIRVFDNHIFVVIGARISLYAMVGPHDLFSTCLFDSDLSKKSLSCMIRLKADMVLLMPVSSADDMVKLICSFSECIDERNDLK